MPHVQITLLEGRTEEQKRRVAERVTQVLAEEADAKREAVGVAFLEVPAENYARERILIADRRRSGSS